LVKFGVKNNMKIARGSKSWILSTFFNGLIFLVLSLILREVELGAVLFLICICFFLLTVFFLVFFRDPDRKIGKNIVAVADGKIREITEENDKDVGKCTKISTFMNVQNVHVNRMPIDGKIIDLKHFSGFHIPAFKKESEKNERVSMLIETKIGMIKVVQIAGTLARRVVPYVKKGDTVKKGERIGIIRLGSRVDVYLPSKKITVKVGSRVKAGEDNIAEINA